MKHLLFCIKVCLEDKICLMYCLQRVLVWDEISAVHTICSTVIIELIGILYITL
jgi:hypothetical protein